MPPDLSPGKLLSAGRLCVEEPKETSISGSGTKQGREPVQTTGSHDHQGHYCWKGQILLGDIQALSPGEL